MTQETALVVQEPPKQEAQAGKLSRLAAFTPVNLTEAVALSKLIASSELAPKDFKGKPGNVLIAMQMGAEVGLAPMQAIQNIAVINGRPSLWGDAALGVVQVHPEYEWHKESLSGDGKDRLATFIIKRKGQDPHTSTFSVAEAMKAGLWGKVGPWQTYPDRMLKMRARGFGLRDKFADALRGLSIAEEAMDIIPDNSSSATKRREEATLDLTSTLTPSPEPNRGHGNEGLTKAPEKKQEPVMCGDCGKIDGHDPTCEHAEQDKRTAQFTKAAFLVISIDRRTKKDTKEPYLVLEVVDPQNHNGKLYVWHKSIHEALMGSVDKNIMVEMSEQKRGSQTYFQIEKLLEIAGQVFVDNKPAEQATMKPTTDEEF